MRLAQPVRSLSLLLFFAVAAGDLGSTAPPPVHATGSPCDGITRDPAPPVGDPVPQISGSVLDVSTSAGIAGLPVKLYRCGSGGSSLVASQTTGASGQFSFTDLDHPHWYFIEVDSASMPGLVPVWPTSNPSALIEIGNGPPSLTLSFD